MRGPSARGAIGAAALACVALFAVPQPAAGARRAPTTLRRTIAGDPALAYSALRRGPGEARVVRGELAAPRPGRRRRRRSLLYFAQLTDFQLADEESPARVEVLDRDSTPLTAAWRPQEALAPYAIDSAIRAVNRRRRSPVRSRGRRARMRLALLTGDLADNAQGNELGWVERLLAGGPLDPNSGTEPAAPCPAGPIPSGEAARYTGVQDPADNPFAAADSYWYPDSPRGSFAAFPSYPRLLDRAQRPFVAAGLRVPSYVAVGNHDELVQGNAAANASFAAVATGCVKPYGPLPRGTISPELLLANPGATAAVPPDPARAFADGPALRAAFEGPDQRDGHGFGFVDPAERSASAGAASYYSFSPRPGLRLISVDSISESGRIGSGGNVDDPQFRWLAGELDRAQRRGELVIVFAHEPVDNLTGDVADEENPPCGTPGSGPGCERDPRSSEPVRLEGDVSRLLLEHRNVLAWIAGSTHRNHVVPYERPGGGGFWAIETVSLADWPSQSRLLELTENCDGTLSLFGTMLDTAAPLRPPPAGTIPDGIDSAGLASLSRELAFNDPQVGGDAGQIGAAADRNVELLLTDPRAGRRTRRAGCRR